MRRATLALDRQCEAAGLEKPWTELHFHPERKWRFDYCWPTEQVAVEIEGGAFLPGGSRHTRGAGYVKDLEKYNEAVILGWRVLRFTPSQVSDGTALTTIERLLKG